MFSWTSFLNGTPRIKRLIYSLDHLNLLHGCYTTLILSSCLLVAILYSVTREFFLNYTETVSFLCKFNSSLFSQKKVQIQHNWIHCLFSLFFWFLVTPLLPVFTICSRRYSCALRCLSASCFLSHLFKALSRLFPLHFCMD